MLKQRWSDVEKLARNCLFYKKGVMKTFYFKVKRVFETNLVDWDYGAYTTGVFLLFIYCIICERQKNCWDHFWWRYWEKKLNTNKNIHKNIHQKTNPTYNSVFRVKNHEDHDISFKLLEKKYLTKHDLLTIIT